jgi:hypothetical protein
MLLLLLRLGGVLLLLQVKIVAMPAVAADAAAALDDFARAKGEGSWGDPTTLLDRLGPASKAAA